MTQHTEGKWSCFENNEGWSVVGPNNEPIAYCDHDLEGDLDTPSPAEANARLIAAAPELLEALIELSQAYEAGEPISAHEGTMEIVRATIAKATGQ